MPKGFRFDPKTVKEGEQFVERIADGTIKRRIPLNEEFDCRLKKFFDEMPTYSSADPLTSFFYLLMRDHLPAGVVTELIAESNGGDTSVFTNGHLAEFAELCAQELMKDALR